MSNHFYLTNLHGSKKITLPSKQQDKFSIGRTPQNSLQILQTTVSKNHALIYFFNSQKKYVLEDLGSINGTFLNGNNIIGSKVYLKHNDQILFGKSEEKYIFKFPNPEPEKKGKINFKDYHFELEDQLSSKPITSNTKPITSDTKPITSNKRQLVQEHASFEGNTQKSWNEIPQRLEDKASSNGKQRFERAIKIPKFEQFLQIQGEEYDQPTRFTQKYKNVSSNEQIEQPPKKWARKTDSQIKGSIKLPQLNKIQLSEGDKINKMMIERRKQLQRAQKQALIRKTQQQQKILQSRLRMQIQQAEQQQRILIQKYEIQKKDEQQQKKMIKEKLMLQQRIRLQQKQLKIRQQLLQQDLREKEQHLMNEIEKTRDYQMLKLKEKEQEIIRKLENQKNKQVEQIREKQVKKREEKDQAVKQQINARRRELQLEAEALTRQYQNIYKETIKKIKFNIQAEQGKVIQLQSSIQKLDSQINGLDSAVKAQQQQHEHLKQQYMDISGRNKAFLMYASHVQTKIDNLKMEAQKKSIKDPSKTSIQLKSSIFHSRKLLNMKLNQHKQLTNQIKQSFLRLNVHSPQSQEYLATILQNYQEIQRLKQIYFQFVEEEKVVQSKWDIELEENNIIDEKVRNIKKEIQANKRKLAENLNDNVKKITEQRLHMLKMMYYAPQDKKQASKFLVQEMLNIEQQVKAIILNSETTHSHITNLIIEIEDKKRENEDLSSLLFGANSSSSHYFDNMKEQINRLIQAIQNQRDEFKIGNFLKVSQQTRDLQNKIYLESLKDKKLKEELKNNGYSVPALNTDKNPLVFFGKMLTKKQKELQAVSQQQSKLEKKLLQMRASVSALKDKKQRMNQLLQDYKQRELRNVRNLLN